MMTLSKALISKPFYNVPNFNEILIYFLRSEVDSLISKKLLDYLRVEDVVMEASLKGD